MASSSTRNVSLITQPASASVPNQAMVGGGTTAQRPANPPQWFIYYDTSFQQQFQWLGSSWALIGPIAQVPQVGAGAAGSRPSAGNVPGFVYTATDTGVISTWSGSVWISAIPTGVISLWGSNSIPAGWLSCDGSVQAISTYPSLASILGTTFGGDGSSTFGLPDFRGRVPVGVGSGTGGFATAWSLGTAAGEEQHQLSVAELASHVHAYQWAPIRRGTAGANPIWANDGFNSTQAAGGDQPHNNLQPSLGIYIIIKT